MDATLNVTEAEIRAEFDAIFDVPQAVDDPHAKTITELAATYGLCNETMRGRVARLMGAGRLEQVFVWRNRADGKPWIVPAYRVVREPKSGGDK